MISIAPQDIQSFSKIFSGAKTRYGKLTRWDKETGEKTLYEEKNKGPIPMGEHLKGINYLGLSPVNEKTRMCEWLGIDIDLYLNPKDICSSVFNLLGTRYFCFMTLNKKWRVVEFLDEPMHVEEAHKRAKELQERIKKELKIETDDKATTPTIPGEEGLVGRWLFLPYGNGYDWCYSPNGTPLNIKQFIFRYKYRNHPIVVAGIGIGGGGKDGSRGNHLYYVQLYKKHFDCDVALKEINKNYGEPLSEFKFTSEESHVAKSVEKDNYDKKYYLNGEPGWIKATCGIKPHSDAKGFSAITTAILENEIYVQSRTDFFELETNEFKSKEQTNDWWKSTMPKGKSGKVKNMSEVLLEDTNLIKVRGYLTHAGLPPGVNSIPRGLVKGLNEGDYLNIYVEPGIKAISGDYKRFDEYYSWLLGTDNWHTEKQKLAFMLRAKEEIHHNGIKIQWFSIWHSTIQGVGKGLFAQFCQSLYGYNNVAPNVKFKQMINTHTTIIEGKQIIFLNEVVLENNTAKTKVLSNEFKDLITEPNLWINPKNKPQIEIPNLCNFWVHSNSDTPLYIEDTDRRAFVINIKHTKQSVNFKLLDEGYKEDILNAIKDPSAFKHHLLNDITYDRKMFFEDAPFTPDKQELIESNKGEFLQEIEERHANNEFPFGDHKEHKGFGMNQEVAIDYKYRGMVNRLNLRRVLKKSEEFRDIYFSLNEIEIALKRISTKWPNGEWTKQIVLSSGKRIRVYCTHPIQVEGTYITEMSEGELGQLYEGDKVPF